MKVTFAQKPNRPAPYEAEATLWFDPFYASPPLAQITDSLQLTGFTIWRTDRGEMFVTVPARSFMQAGKKMYYDYLRGDRPKIQALKDWILAEYKKWQANQGIAGARQIFVDDFKPSVGEN